MDRHAALIATGKTRMRPILMTTLTTILAMVQMVFSDDMAGQMGSGMAIVIIGGLLYATLMTLIVVPVLYDIFFKRAPRVVDIGSENLDDIPDDAAEFIAQALAEEDAKKAIE
jgi:HAE1 family hydrophobic/amphiphilic exporter-1